MPEPSDGIAEEVERQLQLALAAATIAARRAVAARQHQLEQAHHDSQQTAQAAKPQIDAERQLAAAHLQPVFEPEWWETATPREIAGIWQHATSWSDLERDPAAPTIFDHATHRIRAEVHDRTGLDPTQILALAVVQHLEHEHQTTLARPADQPVSVEKPEPDLTAPRDFDDPQHREQLRARLATAGVPDQAINARTLADLGQAREAAEAARTPAAVAPEPPRRPARSVSRGRQRQR